MTGYSSSYFRYKCDVDNCYYEQLPNWDDLIACLPRGIRPTDVDGMVEINGHVLFLEEKRAGVAPHEGQRRALWSLSERDNIRTVFFRPRPALQATTDLECLIFGDGPPRGWQPHSREWLKEWLTEWAARADADQPPGETA